MGLQLHYLYRNLEQVTAKGYLVDPNEQYRFGQPQRWLRQVNGGLFYRIPLWADGSGTILLDADPQGLFGSSFWSPTITDSLPPNRTLAALINSNAPPPDRPARHHFHPTGINNVSIVPANLHLAQ